MDVGPKTPGAGRKTHEGRPLPSPRSHPGLWERKEVEEEARVPLSSTLTGPTAGSLRWVSCSGPWGGPSDTAPQSWAGISRVWAAGGRSGQRGRQWEEHH